MEILAWDSTGQRDTDELKNNNTVHLGNWESVDTYNVSRFTNEMKSFVRNSCMRLCWRNLENSRHLVINNRQAHAHARTLSRRRRTTQRDINTGRVWRQQNDN